MRIPKHLAIIMDGNGRWAEQRGLPRIAGHNKGGEVAQSIVRECLERKIPYLTLYAFSSENWGRPENEVNALMDLLCHYLKNLLHTLLEKRVRLNVIGDVSRLPAAVHAVLKDTVDRTSNNSDMVLTLALSYGGRGEIIRAVRGLVSQVQEGRVKPDEIDEDLFSASLDTVGLPDPDFLIRTSGEKRISNFLLWQLAYAELYFTDVLWPDFDSNELQRALEEFSSRERRFGLTTKQPSARDL